MDHWIEYEEIITWALVRLWESSDGSPLLLMVNAMGSILWNDFVKSWERTMTVWNSYSGVSFCKLWHCIGRGVNCPFANYPFHIEWDGDQTTFELCLCELGLSSLCSHDGTSCFDAYYVNMIFLPIVIPVERVHHNNLLVHSVLQTMVLIHLS